ncbi:hypothetical protein EFD56_22850 [Rhizobium phaseoli]|nr:hypothetical protein EFD56_22850 [Rhizobium phaseoli]
MLGLVPSICLGSIGHQILGTRSRMTLEGKAEGCHIVKAAPDSGLCAFRDHYSGLAGILSPLALAGRAMQRSSQSETAGKLA